MNTCVICHTAYDPFCDETGKVLIDYKTGICISCKHKIENGEIKLEDYDLEALNLESDE